MLFQSRVSESVPKIAKLSGAAFSTFLRRRNSSVNSSVTSERFSGLSYFNVIQ